MTDFKQTAKEYVEIMEDRGIWEQERKGIEDSYKEALEGSNSRKREIDSRQKDVDNRFKHVKGPMILDAGKMYLHVKNGQVTTVAKV